jgi:hypothetical protein
MINVCIENISKNVTTFYGRLILINKNLNIEGKIKNEV